MPGRDGYSLIREIERGKKRPALTDHLPAVALTAYGRVEDKVEIFSSGFDSHVVKPVDPAELAADHQATGGSGPLGSDKA